MSGRQRKTGTSGNTPAKSRATAVLDEKRRMTVFGDGLDLESFLQTLEELIARLRKFRTRGIGLPTSLRILKEEAKAC